MRAARMFEFDCRARIAGEKPFVLPAHFMHCRQSYGMTRLTMCELRSSSPSSLRPTGACHPGTRPASTIIPLRTSVASWMLSSGAWSWCGTAGAMLQPATASPRCAGVRSRTALACTALALLCCLQLESEEHIADIETQGHLMTAVLKFMAQPIP